MLPVLFIIDILTFPFHCINVCYRRCRNTPYNGEYYWYEYIMRPNPRRTEIIPASPFQPRLSVEDNQVNTNLIQSPLMPRAVLR